MQRKCGVPGAASRLRPAHGGPKSKTADPLIAADPRTEPKQAKHALFYFFFLDIAKGVESGRVAIGICLSVLAMSEKAGKKMLICTGQTCFPFPLILPRRVASAPRPDRVSPRLSFVCQRPRSQRSAAQRRLQESWGELGRIAKVSLRRCRFGLRRRLTHR